MRVKAYATLRDLLGGSQFDVPVTGQSTVGQVLQQFVAAHPDLASKLWDEAGKLTGYVTVLLNGRSIEYLAGLQTAVGDTDTLSLFPPVGGG